MYPYRLGLEQLEDRRLLAIDFEVLQDTNPEPINDGDFVTPLSQVGDQVFFTATNRQYGHELWKSDGTEQGTQLVLDINPGGLDGIPSDRPELMAADEQLFFVAEQPKFGEELWKTDGTNAGTTLVEDITPGKDGSDIELLESIDSGLLFRVSAESADSLWFSGGSAEQTFSLMEIRDSYISATPRDRSFALISEATFDPLRENFVLTDGTPEGTHRLDFTFDLISGYAELEHDVLFTAGIEDSTELWTSDGTVEGTRRLRKFESDSTASIHIPSPNDLGTGVALLYFDQLNRTELWRTDGTEEGTYVVQTWDVPVELDGDQLPMWTNPGVTTMNGVFFFRVRSSEYGEQLWRSDGSTEGTYALTTAAAFSIEDTRYELIDHFVFSVKASPHASEDLWRTDGTVAGTYVLDVVPELLAGKNPVEINGRYVFGGLDRDHGAELWVTDGTEAGTYLMKEINPLGVGFGVTSGVPVWNPVRQGNVLLFRANPGNPVVNGEYGLDLWRTDGTSDGTYPVKHIESGTEGTYFSDLIEQEGHVFLQSERTLWSSDGTTIEKIASSGYSRPRIHQINGRTLFALEDRLWRTSGTSDTTYVIHGLPADIVWTAHDDSDPSILYVATRREVGGNEIWVSDGTHAGTRLIRELPRCPLFSDLQLHKSSVVGGKFFFPGCEDTGQMWVADESNGVQMLADLGETFGSSRGQFARFGDKLVFAEVGEDQEVWVSDGTVDGTFRLRDIRPGFFGSNAHLNLGGSDCYRNCNEPYEHPVILDGVLYFSASDGTKRDLWRTDGTREGTHRIFNDEFQDPEHVRLFNGKLLFSAADAEGDRHLWTSDGTTSGSTKLASVSVEGLYPVGAEILFWANEGSFDVERYLWRTDATPEGTMRVTRSEGRGPLFEGHNNEWLFVAEEEATGSEIWKTDGSAEGTRIVRDIQLGQEGSNPYIVGSIDGHVYFSSSFQGDSALWATDGTEEGTRLVDTSGDIPRGGGAMGMVGDRVYLVAAHPIYGNEFWTGTFTPDRRPWQNPENQYDVDSDTVISPQDVLAIINEIQLRRFSDEGGAIQLDTEPDNYFDVDGDGFISPTDAVQVVNRLSLAQSLAAGNPSSRLVLESITEEDEFSQPFWTELIDPIFAEDDNWF